jgi:hypothetical protein
MLFTNHLKDWAGTMIGVVHNVDSGGAVAFPGLDNPVAFDQGVCFEIKAIGRDLANPLLVEFDPSKSTIAPNEGWNYCSMAMAGVQGVEAEAKDDVLLPEWDDSSKDVVDKYTDFVRNLSTKLKPTHAGENPDNLLSRRRRLEGVAGFVVGNDVLWDRIQIFRVRNALAKEGPTETRDWIVYKLSWLPGNQLAAQEGGGHGPPDRK